MTDLETLSRSVALMLALILPSSAGKTTYCPLAKPAAIGAVLSSPSATISVTVCVKQ